MRSYLDRPSRRKDVVVEVRGSAKSRFNHTLQRPLTELAAALPKDFPTGDKPILRLPVHRSPAVEQNVLVHVPAQNNEQPSDAGYEAFVQKAAAGELFGGSARVITSRKHENGKAHAPPEVVARVEQPQPMIPSEAPRRETDRRDTPPPEPVAPEPVAPEITANEPVVSAIAERATPFMPPTPSDDPAKRNPDKFAAAERALFGKPTEAATTAPMLPGETTPAWQGSRILPALDQPAPKTLRQPEPVLHLVAKTTEPVSLISDLLSPVEDPVVAPILEKVRRVRGPDKAPRKRRAAIKAPPQLRNPAPRQEQLELVADAELGSAKPRRVDAKPVSNLPVQQAPLEPAHAELPALIVPTVLVPVRYFKAPALTSFTRARNAMGRAIEPPRWERFKKVKMG